LPSDEAVRLADFGDEGGEAPSASTGPAGPRDSRSDLGELRPAASSARSARGTRTIKFGRFTLSKVYSKGVQCGWAADCDRHTSHLDPEARCRTQLTYGGVRTTRLSDEEILRGLKRWLVYGYTIACTKEEAIAEGEAEEDQELTQIQKHLKIGPRKCAEESPDEDEDLEDVAEALEGT